MASSFPQKICQAAVQGDLATVRSLLSLDPRLATAKYNGFTALLAGAACGHPGVVRLLLQHGVDTEEKTTDGYTPLVLAVVRGGQCINFQSIHVMIPKIFFNSAIY